MGDWKFTGDDFDERELRDALDTVVHETAHAVRADAAAASPVDTGALQASLYASTPKRSDYGFAIARMRAQNPNVRAESETPREDWSGDDVHTALVDSAAPYAPLIHDGHFNVMAGRFINGRPFLNNALRGQQDRMMVRAAEILRRLKVKNVSKG